ncbi:unnamed protein product [Symbiodinium natans]|uniref:Uncharacterized protein n=1 Tax=Symbiodinium natans TaxID=878477 RepID=A0A812TU53_9DINO|nr:unnamed protein product [Symbiodinium natans]
MLVRRTWTPLRLPERQLEFQRRAQAATCVQTRTTRFFSPATAGHMGDPGGPRRGNHQVQLGKRIPGATNVGGL